jgi:hypothetical protein
MKKVSEYLDMAKALTSSDYRTAKVLNITRSAVSHMRKTNTISDENAENLAQLINVNPAEIIAASRIQIRPESKDIWLKWIAASVILSLGIIGFSASNTGAYVSPKSDANIHYASFNWDEI